jgi:phage protein U
VLALIGDFKFEINDTNIDKIKSTLNFNFKTNHRLGNFDGYQATGMYEEGLELDGVLIAKSQKQLLEFETMAKLKLPVTFVTDNVIKTILIFRLEREKSNFLKDGAFIKQSYKMVLQVVGDGFRTI